MGLSPMPSGKELAEAAMPSLLKEACELIAFNSPAVKSPCQNRER